MENANRQQIDQLMQGMNAAVELFKKSLPLDKQALFNRYHQEIKAVLAVDISDMTPEEIAAKTAEMFQKVNDLQKQYADANSK